MVPPSTASSGMWAMLALVYTRGEQRRLSMALDDVKHQVALGSRILAFTGLAAGIRSSMGHVSLRDPGDPKRFVVKGRGYPIDTLSRMRPENMVLCDLDGRLL